MKHLFFQSPVRTEQEGFPLADDQKETLEALLAEACRLDDSPLACRIADQILTEADWKQVRVMVEAVPGKEQCERIHLNFPIKGCVGQMELYSWRDDSNDLRMGIGTTDCTEF